MEVLFLPSGDLNVSVRSMNTSSRYALRGIADNGGVFFGCKCYFGKSIVRPFLLFLINDM
jgi:hypothetical protein